MKRRLLTAVRLLLCLTCCFTVPSLADGDSAFTSSGTPQVGFEGHYRLGHWTPITFASPEAALAGFSVPDDEGTATRFWWRKPNQGEPSTGQPGTTEDPRSNVFLQIGKPLDNYTPVLNSQQFAVVLGEGIDLAQTTRLQQREPEEALVVAHVAAEQLPLQWFAWEGVDLLIVPTGDRELIDAVSETQWDAVAEWVKTGGKLLLSVGANGEDVMRDGGPLAAFAPGALQQVVNQRQTGGLENYAAPSRRTSTTRIQLTDELGRFDGIPAVAIEFTDGIALCSDGRGASRVNWVVKRAFGLGTVTFVATDLDRSPLSDWDGYPRLLLRLLKDTLHGREDETTDWKSQSVTHFGFTDISGQLRSALEQFPGVGIVPFGLIGLIAVGFAVAIGPIDYMLLGRHPSRAKWTWFTLAIAVLATTLGIVAIATTWKGRQPLANQVTLLDVDTPTGIVRGTSWAHVYTHVATETAARFSSHRSVAGASRSDTLIGWQGLAGDGFGGMNSRTPTTGPLAVQLPSYDVIITHSEEGWSSEVEGALIPKWSSRRFKALWRETLEPCETDLVVAQRTGLLSGTITNPLSETIKSPYLCFDRWLFELDDLRPGQAYRIDQSATPIDLKSRLTNRQIMDAKQIASPWDEGSFDVPRIMEMVMFHDAAGGRSYTSLLHRQAAWLDLSDHLTLNRAVLVGRLAPKEGVIEIDLAGNQPTTRHCNLCRLVFSVETN